MNTIAKSFLWLLLMTLLINGDITLADESSTPSAHQALESAKSYIKRNQWGIAREVLKEALQRTSEEPERSRLMAELGMVELRMEPDDQSEGMVLDAIHGHQGSQEELFRWSAALLNAWKDKVPPDVRFPDLLKQATKLAGEDQEKRNQLGLIALSHDVQVDPLKVQQAAAEWSEKLLKSPPSETRALELITLDSLLLSAEKKSAASLPTLKAIRFQLLNQSIEDSQGLPDIQAKAYLELIRLYRENQRDEDALKIAGQAVQAMDRIADPRNRWELLAQKGQLEKKQGHMERALKDYGDAFDDAENLRKDFPKKDDQGMSWFFSQLEPIYLDRVELLVDRAEATGQVTQRRDFLKDAIFTLESINRSALEDFLGHSCGVPERRKSASDLLLKGEAGTAFLYPFVTKNRITILMAAGGDIEAYSIRTPSPPSILQKMQSLSRMLAKPSSNPEPLAKELYMLLFAPLEPKLKQNQIKTLVIVPDRQFRKIPFAALHSGEDYLVRRYQFATLTGLSLFTPEEEDRSSGERILLAGVSDPGPVVSHLPEAVAKEVLLSSRSTEKSSANTLTETPSTTPQRSISHALQLPGVKKEIEALTPMANTALMNETFTLEALKENLRTHAYSALHIASHGVIGRSADASYILAYDDLLRFEMLDGFLKEGGKGQKKLGLLTLSACHTAEGDDQAPLGLSGLALRSGIPRAMGSLWPVDDAATVNLMQSFYQAYVQNGQPATMALKEAQQSVINTKGSEHPYYWAPFILVGQWW
jgi:CHAT domain-containing protein